MVFDSENSPNGKRTCRGLTSCTDSPSGDVCIC